jgi:uncharacterized protein (TIGR03435 family)
MLRFVGVRRRAPMPAAFGGDAGAGTAMRQWMPGLVAAWLLGVTALLVRLAGGLWRVRALRRATRALPDSEWQAACDRVARALGVRRRVRVADATFVDGPVVIGWLRPVVLLPVAAVSGLTPQQIEAILAHELAHVRRHDAVVNACQTAAETLLFYHPAVWWASARIREEREHCCDDVALSVSGDPVGYASALAELESWRVHNPPLALAATGGSLLARITRVLTPSRPAGAGGATTAALVVAFVVTGGALQFLVARQPSRMHGPVADAPAPRAWRMRFDHPSGQMTISGFTARDLVRYAYQLPMSHIVGGPAWLDTDAFELSMTVDHVPSADETPGLVRTLLEERFRLVVHESTVQVPAYLLQLARPDGSLGPNLQPATQECFDQKAWIAADHPPNARWGAVPTCGVWDGGLAGQRVRGITMDEFAEAMPHHVAPGLRHPVLNRTNLPGAFDVSLELFRPAAFVMDSAPSLRVPLQIAGFASVADALEEQLGLALVAATAEAPAIVIDQIHLPLP